MMHWQNWLLAAALTDWLIGRTFSRAAIFMPKTGVMVGVAQALTVVGQVAFNLASLLTLGAILWLTLRGFRRTERNVPLSLALAGLIGLSLAGVFVAPGPMSLLLFHALTLAALAILVTDGLRARSDMRARLVIILPALAIGAMALFKIDHALGLLFNRSEPPMAALATFQVGELFVALTPLAAWWAHGRLGQARDGVIAAIPTVLFVGAYAASPSLTATMATWSLGLSLYLPWPVYAIGLWLAALTIGRAIRAGQPAGHGLAFLVAAGYTMQLSSQVMLGLLGIWWLSQERLSVHSVRSSLAGQPEASPAGA